MNILCRNIELILAYNGEHFKGWQIQPRVRTVQGVLNASLYHLLGETVVTTGSSRTDAGVHAHDQHVTFKMKNPIPLNSFRRALNHHLPPDVRLITALEVPMDYSARYGACGKHYVYLIHSGDDLNPFLGSYALQLDRYPDVVGMHQAAVLFQGVHELPSLQSAHDARASARVWIHHSSVEKRGPFTLFHVIGHSFLYKMVRTMAGSLLKVGLGDWDIPSFKKNMYSGERKKMGATAPANGLHLLKVYYEKEEYSTTAGMKRFNQSFGALCEDFSAER
jgi:tRNA pseudouridine38-40 synthase